ncbi:hypothetical protein [Pseudorhodoferax sp. Leaf265]|uniref:hypothetical protein n=1 Tax=Pseudorhodoferax sp. Leaf265 TaxID=1736315 RepID=UPI0006FF4E1C|nr:hypothetical protein [Pseudorhodoferax sp. Leaf265]KQP02489.1 hypothetical protein ASF45_20765 [Pseudorhodoferax sp. Leaf265]
MDKQKLLADMKSKLESAGIPYESIQVFGAICCNVHITCLSIDAAEKWSQLLVGVFKGAQVRVADYTWNASKNKGTSMLPTKRRGYLVALAA